MAPQAVQHAYHVGEGRTLPLWERLRLSHAFRVHLALFRQRRGLWPRIRVSSVLWAPIPRTRAPHPSKTVLSVIMEHMLASLDQRVLAV